MCRLIEKILRVRMENIKMSTVSTSKSFSYMFSYINTCVYMLYLTFMSYFLLEMN